MVSLPELTSYSDAETAALAAYSPVFNTYHNHLSRQPTSFSDEVRIKKHASWLQCALATFHNLRTPEEVCFFWSQQTDQILKDVWTHCELNKDEISLLLYGKLGSHELNLSSDIDLTFVRTNQSDSTPLQVKIKKFIRILSENTSFGFAYRVDLNLRPGGAASPLVPTKDHFFNFYDEFLEAWHRLSFIRMRPLYPNTVLSEDLSSYCKKRCFPKRLDFSVIEEIKNVRLKINHQWRQSQEPFDLKLHPGGIRDIELYIHSLQVIYGGRHPELKIASISQAIAALARMGALKKEESQFLLNFYWSLRKIENLIHIKEDQHTYLLHPSYEQHLASHALSIQDLEKSFSQSERIVSEFFRATPKLTPRSTGGMSQLSEASKKSIEDIRNLKSVSIKKQGIESLKEDILQFYIEKVQEIAIDEDLAIQIFKDFIFAIKSKTTIFYLLHRQKKLLENLAWLFSISPFIGQILTRRPELMDSFTIGQVAIDENDDLEALWDSLLDYKLLGQMMAVIDLFKKQDLQEYTLHLSQQADFILHQLMQFLSKELNAEPLQILAMGKWSGMELGVRSDLDFVFISDQEPTSAQIKLARRIITILTSRSNAGRLYDIDLRLKPHESAGPLILQKSALFQFIIDKAQAWQKLAYLRSRLLGNQSFYLKDHFDDLRLTESENQEMNDIRLKLLVTPSPESIDIKYCPGGLLETELLVQKYVLSQERPPAHPSTIALIRHLSLPQQSKEELINNYLFLRRFEQVFQITNDSSSTKVGRNSSNLSRVSKILNVPDVFTHLMNIVGHQQQCLKALT